jgi:hypothetical protein
MKEENYKLILDAVLRHGLKKEKKITSMQGKEL